MEGYPEGLLFFFQGFLRANREALFLLNTDGEKGYLCYVSLFVY
jgi:hypothetical protein